LILKEKGEGFRGLGTYIVDPHYERNLVLEIPHAIYDRETLAEGTRMFQETAARGLFITGTHRCANSASSPCSGSTTVCNPASGPYRISDVAHYTENYFQEAHRAILSSSCPPVAISVHGYSPSGSAPEITLSDGTRFPAATDALVNRLRGALMAQGLSVGSCNFAEDMPLSYCATTNVQGRLTNNSESPCTSAAVDSAGLFIHMEQLLHVRQSPAGVIAALKEVFPAGAIHPHTTYFAQVAVGGGFATGFTLINTGDVDAVGNLILTDRLGGPFPVSCPVSGSTESSVFAIAIPAGGVRVLECGRPGVSIVGTGWARVESCDAPVRGTATYSFSEAAMLKTVVAVLGAEPVGSAVFPVNNDDSLERYMGFAVANPGDEAIELDMDIVDENGAIVETLEPADFHPLPPRKKVAKFVHEYRPNLKSFTGSVILRAREGDRFVAVGLVLHQGIYTASPIFEKDAQNPLGFTHPSFPRFSDTVQPAGCTSPADSRHRMKKSHHQPS